MSVWTCVNVCEQCSTSSIPSRVHSLFTPSVPGIANEWCNPAGKKGCSIAGILSPQIYYLIALVEWVMELPISSWAQDMWFCADSQLIRQAVQFPQHLFVTPRCYHQGCCLTCVPCVYNHFNRCIFVRLPIRTTDSRRDWIYHECYCLKYND